MYGRGRNNVEHLGDWLIDLFPHDRRHRSTSRCRSATRSGRTARSTAPSRPSSATSRSIRRACSRCCARSPRPNSRPMPSSRRAEMPDVVSGNFRSMLIDIFGRSYPEKEFFMVDRDAVTPLQGARPPQRGRGRASASTPSCATWRWRRPDQPVYRRYLFSRGPAYIAAGINQRIEVPVMAGHSQFKNIMHKKGRADKARSKLFAKLAREITVAAKLGMPDPAFNPRLRAAILAARAENMPKDNIERAIKKSARRRRRELRRDPLRGLRARAASR